MTNTQRYLVCNDIKQREKEKILTMEKLDSNVELIIKTSACQFFVTQLIVFMFSVGKEFICEVGLTVAGEDCVAVGH